MPHNISRRDFLRKLKVFGFAGPHAGSKHSFMIKGDLKLRIPNPHQGDISASLLSRLLRQAGISNDQWLGEK